MRGIAAAVGLTALLVGAGLVTLGPGCTPTLWKNLTAERTGTVTVVFINSTSARAVFSYGTWDSLDRNPPGQIDFNQLRVDAQSTTLPVSLVCARNFAIGTQELCDRTVDARADETDDFDPDAFDTVVHFSDQPADSELAGIATAGTAAGVEKLLGVDFACGDQLVFTFREDPNVEGGFRIDFALIPEGEQPPEG